MKRVLIIGATGSLASHVIEQLKELPAVELTLFVRDILRLPGKTENHFVFKGDALNYADVKKAVNGKDIVIVALSGDLESMAKNIVTAMEESGVHRLIAISSIGIYKEPLRPILIPYRKLADIIENSNLAYTILRPDWFTDTNEIDYMITRRYDKEAGRAISRKSIASFVARIIENPDLYINENLGISRPA